ncbi:protein-disulfide reductase DsbD [Caldichromatium japonicum]|uniref:protein-disulfide reductase DsbD n=1 Tax=Caldichromatium japonicum TaxID=2699430 RepID=UPI001FECF41C|nr:protein-disulfide reductase DsbD [Caldichromatium japonicum]
MRLHLWLALWCLCLVTGAWGDEFLSQEQAFPLHAEILDTERIRLNWEIAPGYYLYRSKLRFISQTQGIALGSPELPSAETKQDEFFGEVEIYRGQLTVELPIVRAPGTGDRLELEVGFQGCADAGFCYPPHRERMLLALPPSPVSLALAAGPGEGSSLSKGDQPRPKHLTSLLASVPQAGQPEIPEVDAAFVFDSQQIAPDRVRLNWTIAPGTYLYAERVQVTLADPAGVALGQIQRPAGVVKPEMVRPDGTVGAVEIYEGRIDLEVPLMRSDPELTEARLSVSYQGCAEIGICYPPQTREVRVALGGAPVKASPVPSQVARPMPIGKTGDQAVSPPPAEQDRIAGLLASSRLWAIVVAFFGFGLLLAFTPCVFPMVPILSGIIVGQGPEITARRAFVLSLVYVLAMALTYTLAGVLSGLLGANLQAAFQNPWVLTAFAAVFVLLALSMFGFYELQLPSALQSQLAALCNRQQGGTLLGVAIMGVLSALIVGPCVAPPLFGALAYIGQTGDGLLGGFALFALSLGMGVPLLAIGTSAGKLLPRAGAWMESVKAVFGVLLLGVAILMLERILPPALSLILWGLLLICSAVYLGALSPLKPDASGWRKLWKGLGVALLVYGALMLVGAAAGGQDTLQPLRGLIASGVGAGAEVSFKPIKTLADLEQELTQAGGRPVLLDFYADWCVSCKEMERATFSDPDVQAELRRFVLLRADVTANDAEDRALQRRFGIPGPPALLFFDAAGREHPQTRVIGFQPPAAFIAHLQGVRP